jgi:mono/diheme cytochrome c family protein
MACHTVEPGVGVEGGGRGPNWADLAVRRAQGVPGGPDNLIEYLSQALFEPSAYLVDGYADIMPAATDAPAKLTYEETVAAINYLQTMGGTPSVRLGDIPRPEAATGAGPATTDSQAVSVEPSALFSTFKCAACHGLAPGEVRVGPVLDAAGLIATAADRGVTAEGYVMESIVDPASFEKEGFPSGVMPPDFGTQLTAGQLQALVNYLLPAGGE